jgi:hypothetical protein
MGGACSTHGVMRNIYKILVESLKEIYYSEDLGIDEKVI